MIRILLADNQAIFRAGTARVLEAEADVRILGLCDDPASLLDAILTTRNCVILLAASLGADFDSILAATAAAQSRVILMIDTPEEPPPTVKARLAGLLTRHVSAVDLITCIRSVSDGERALGMATPNPTDAMGHRMCEVLTPRELQIVGFVVQGYKNRQIADELGTGEQVVKNYLRAIYDKTGSSDRLELALFTLHHRVLAQAAAKAADGLLQRV